MTAQVSSKGLTASEAALRLQQYGANAVAEQRVRRWIVLLRKFWAPVPWMLEATIALQLALGKLQEAAVIATLLIANALLSFLQENRADKALALLRQRLAVQARVLRDGQWQLVAASELVPGDVIHLRLGDLVPADVRLDVGAIQLDQSTLTGESLPVDAQVGVIAYSGSLVKRGEASGEIVATGARTRFGQTAELVRTAKTSSHLQSLIFAIVKYLILLDAALVVMLLTYALATSMPLSEVIPYTLILLVASVPVALPATFTLATALGALELAQRGVLVTRLSAVEDAATMDILVTDKTGTITENRLAVAALAPLDDKTSEQDLLRLAALTCDESTQDPIDLAVLTAARARGLTNDLPPRQRYIPFDPATRRSEAWFEQDGQLLRAIKGAPKAIAALVPDAPDIAVAVERFAAQGNRVLAVASGTAQTLQLVGLIALEDPPRADSSALIQDLQTMGLRMVMATGDNESTARAIAMRVGIGNRTCAPASLREGGVVKINECDVFARVYPEDKLHLVTTLQHDGHVVGMTGDGVNDAPALKQAEVGIAVANATDVAKAAASLVLIEPGLANIKHAVQTSRRIHQRMLTYTLNKIIKTLEIAIFLSLGVMLTGEFVITPALIVLLLFTNDFVTMAIATDNVSASPTPARWHIRKLMFTAAPLAAGMLGLSFAIFFAGRDWLHLPLPQLQTLIFVMLVFTGIGNVYLVRERGHFWRSRPSRWLLFSSIADVLVVSVLASQGILMTPIDASLIAALFAVTSSYLVTVDFLKVRMLR